ncbi:hypothetical protein GCM10022225_07530 [Plantactinospora mayteni]|uniref:Cupin type-2 domain-containing protein n=2 Tax=Plantactinospora mayteni TaxID=566021 RepID=A0ABQ4EJT7_9ACTN|nr:hypothetical protein Pma05_10740 [Plantactinospora mayteni]
MAQAESPVASTLDAVRRHLEHLDARERREALMEFARLLAAMPSDDLRAGHGTADRAGDNRAVVLCDWAADGGCVDDEQLLRVDLRRRDVQIAKTREATGRPLITNGFLGADLIQVPAGEGFAPHTHPGDHLLFVLGGRGTITAAGEILETTPGQVYMVDGAQPHAVGAISDHVLLSVGVAHQPLDSANRQELRPFEELLTEDGHLHCRICDVKAGSGEELRRDGCPHGPAVFDSTGG